MKNNKLFVLLGITLLSFSSLTGCKGKKENTVTDNYQHVYIDEHGVVTTGYSDVHVDPSKTYYQGVHDFTYTQTGKALIRNGQTKYKLVIPENAFGQISTARDEFVHFFKQATEIDIPVILDRNLSFNKDDTYISLGNTKLYETSGLDENLNSLTDDGVRIITKNNTIFLLGGSDYGVLHAVYDFMHIYFRYEQYSPDIYEIDRNVKNITLYNFDVTDIPDIPHRAQNYGFVIPGNGNYDQSHYGYRMRNTKGRGFYFMPVYRIIGDYSSPSKISTNTNTYVPFDLYSGSHPSWFSDLSTTKDPQLCYTAHGNAEEYEALVDLVTKKIQNSMVHFTPKDYPQMNVMTFTMEDNHNTCNCEHCRQYEAKYGAISSTLITFVNEVARRIDAWQKLEENKEYYRENFQIIYFAYNAFVDAPVNIHEGKENTYTPSYPEVVLEKNTGVYLAIIDRGDVQFDFFNNPLHRGGVNGNMGIKETIDSWGCLTDSTYLWLYQTNFTLYPYFFDSFSFYNQKMYNYISSKGLKMFFAQGQDTKESGNTGTNFNNLKVYLNTKLSWDSTLDQHTLVTRYFKAMYGEAYQEMWNYFGLLRGFYAQMLEDNYDTLVNERSIYNRIDKREYISFGGLNGLIAQIDKAQEVNANSRASEEQKRIFKYNIEAEAFFPLYAKLSLYGSIDLTYQECVEIATRLKDDIFALRLEGMSTRESDGMSVIELPNMYL